MKTITNMEKYEDFNLSEAQINLVKKLNQRRAIQNYIREHGEEPTQELVDSFFDASEEQLEVFKRSFYATELIMNNSHTNVHTFAGLEIAPAPLYYGANGFEIKDNDWNHDSYEQVYGTNDGSYYFNYIDLGKYFDSKGSNFSDEDKEIDNENTLDGWRVPSSFEYDSILTTDSSTRPGSTVNGQTNKHYVGILVDEINMFGLLVFPDNETITGCELNYMDPTEFYDGVDTEINYNTITDYELNNYLSQGCVFLNAAGIFQDEIWGEKSNLGIIFLANGKLLYFHNFKNGVIGCGWIEEPYLYTQTRLVKGTFIQPEYKQHTFTIIPSPSDATITINGVEQSTILAYPGDMITFIVERPGYSSHQETIEMINKNAVMYVTLFKIA